MLFRSPGDVGQPAGPSAVAGTGANLPEVGGERVDGPFAVSIRYSDGRVVLRAFGDEISASEWYNSAKKDPQVKAVASQRIKPTATKAEVVSAGEAKWGNGKISWWTGEPEPVASIPAAAQESRAPTEADKNHILPATEDWIPSGDKAKVRANLDAIKLLKQQIGRAHV